MWIKFDNMLINSEDYDCFGFEIDEQRRYFAVVANPKDTVNKSQLYEENYPSVEALQNRLDYLKDELNGK